jgi:FtsP/CotA-like multicopper oxidase with cupredoxin domain
MIKKRTNLAALAVTIITYGFLSSVILGGTKNYLIFAQSGSLVISGKGGTTIPAWGYTDVSGSPKFPGPQLEAVEGDTVNITLVNNHNTNHNFVVKGISDSDQTSVAPAKGYTYKFTASKAGTYLYTDTLNSSINRALGMYGAFIIRPSNGTKTVFTGSPYYDTEKVWVVGEMDKPKWNDIASTGGTVNTSVYKPNYFIMNGKGGFAAMQDTAKTTLTGVVGNNALARIVNGGQFSHSLHFHGGHILIIAENGIPLSSPRWATTVNVKPNSTSDVIYAMIQPGVFPMHVHTAQMETANGVYLNGVVAMIVIN